MQKVIVKLGKNNQCQVFNKFIDHIYENLINFCVDEFSCRIVQRFLQLNNHKAIDQIIDKILENYNELIIN